MEDLDRRILTALQDDATLSVSDLAHKMHLSNTSCWRRLKKLEEDGVILGRVTLLDASALGLTVNVFANIRLKQHDEDTLRSFEAEVQAHGQIVDCFSVSGDFDYILRVVTTSIEAYERFLKKVVLHLPGVGSVNSCFALGRVKNTTALPILGTS